jgi:hypothetical protein
MISGRSLPYLPVLALAALLALSADRPAGAQAPKRAGRSHVTLIAPDGSNKAVVYSADRVFEAPNWTPDGKNLILNAEGKLWRLSVTGGEPQLIETGAVKKINNDHGIAPDGSLLAISAGTIYVLPAAGGVPRQVTELMPSYYHGWSPDGRTLAYCARRNDNFDLYAIAVSGGAEQRLTEHVGYDDGPDYSPDGRWIYFNSDRSGSWDIWRIPADGAGPGDTKAERITQDEWEDWFPHPSPDGRWLVFLSFPQGTKGHPPDQNIVLRRMPLPGSSVSDVPIAEVVRLFGGQGTINVNSWSPDSRRFAYVSYEAIGPATGALPARWNHQDVGDVAVAGTARHDDGTFTLTGTLDIWGKADGFHYAYLPLDGDGQIVVRVTAVENTNNHAKAGVMIRESLAPEARHATMVVTPVDGTQFLRRTEAGAATTNTNPHRNRGTLPYWVKLVRKGNEFSAFESLDGTEWVLADTVTVPMSREALIGLVASSHQKTVTSTAKLDHVTLGP